MAALAPARPCVSAARQYADETDRRYCKDNLRDHAFSKVIETRIANSVADLISRNRRHRANQNLFAEDSFANLFALCIGQMECGELYVLRHGAAPLFYCSGRMLIFIGVSTVYCERQHYAGRHE